MSLAIPPGGLTTKTVPPTTATNPTTSAAKAAQPKESPAEAAIAAAIPKLTVPGESATLTVTANGKASLSGLGVSGGEASVSGSAAVSVTYNGTGNYSVTMTQTQQAGVKVSSGDEPEAEGSGKKSLLSTIGGLFLGPKTGEDEPPATGAGEGTGKGATTGTGAATGIATGTGVVPVAGAVGGIPVVTASGAGIFAQAKAPEKENGSAVGVEATPPESSGVETNPSASAEAKVSVTSTVTVNAVNTKQPSVALEDAVNTAKGFAQMAATPQPASLVNNPIMNQITGKSPNVAGVSPSTLDYMQKNVASYGETISGTSSVVAGVETKFGADSLSKIGVQDDQQTSLSRTVTLPTSTTNGIETDATPSQGAPATIAYTVSTQNSPQASAEILGVSMKPQSSVQVSDTQIYNLKSPGAVADPEGTLTKQGQWGKPDTTQNTVQTQTQYGAGTTLGKFSSGDSFVQTTTITKTTQPGKDPTISTTQTAAENNTVQVGEDDGPINANLTFSTPVYA